MPEAGTVTRPKGSPRVRRRRAPRPPTRAAVSPGPARRAVPPPAPTRRAVSQGRLRTQYRALRGAGPASRPRAAHEPHIRRRPHSGERAVRPPRPPPSAAGPVNARRPGASVLVLCCPPPPPPPPWAGRQPVGSGSLFSDFLRPKGGKHSEAGDGRPVDRGAWTANDPHNNQHNPQYANYRAPLTRKRHIPPHPAQPRHTNYWAPRTRKRHQQEHRPQRPTEISDPTQHAKGRPGDCPGPGKETTRRNVTQGGATWSTRPSPPSPVEIPKFWDPPLGNVNFWLGNWALKGQCSGRLTEGAVQRAVDRRGSAAGG